MGIDDTEPVAGGGQDWTILELDSVSHSIAWHLIGEIWIFAQKSPRNK